MNKLFINETLDQQRIALLPKLAKFKNNFYLAGGTALALQLGHRKSIDFDFFTEKDFETNELKENPIEVFQNQAVKINQESKNTLEIEVEDGIKISFITYKYPLIEPKLNTEYLNIASVNDIACMKLQAILSRSTLKDYADLYFILKMYPLKKLLKICERKLPSLNQNLIIKSLIYFDDISESQILYTPGNEIQIDEIKKYLMKTVSELD